jgi:hypothetical protein
MPETSFEEWWETSAPEGGFKQVARVAYGAARESVAAKVEARGCICKELWMASQSEPGVYSFEGWFKGTRTYTDFDTLAEHDPRCPVALARQIREGQP